MSEEDKKRSEALDALAELQRMKGVTRFEVIDDTGRAYVKYLHRDQGEKIKYSLQDDNRTLKVFIDKRDDV